MKTSRLSMAILILFLLGGCSSTVPRQDPVGQVFPSVQGDSLGDKSWRIPEDIAGKPSLLLVGYKHKSQFDIDRWLIGLDQKKITINTFELPTLDSWFAQLFARNIDDAMREGIPGDLWKAVITVYDDADKIIQFLGNAAPKNARVVLIGPEGKVDYFYDEGFSVRGLNALFDVICSKYSQQNSSCEE